MTPCTADLAPYERADPRERLAGMHDSYAELRAAIEKSGYYPDVVADAVNAAVAGEHVVS